MTRKKKLLFYGITLLAPLLLLELGTRVYFAIQVGPSILLYGTRFHRRKIPSESHPSIQPTTQRPEAGTYWLQWRTLPDK